MHAERSATPRRLSLTQSRTDAAAKPPCPRVGVFETITEESRSIRRAGLGGAKGCANTSTSDLKLRSLCGPFHAAQSVRCYDSWMSVRGLFETHLTVADLSRSVAFYRDVVGLPVALEVPERGAAFHWIGQPGQAMLGLWSIGSAPMNMQLHIAFGMSLRDVLAAPERLRSQGIQPLSFFGEPADEPSVIGWMPAAAIYFHDPDRHQLEYLAMLDSPARPELGIVPWSQLGD